MADYVVLIALDGSSLAEHSLAYLPALSKLGAVEVHLIGVVDESQDAHDMASVEMRERERHMMTAYLGEIAQSIKTHLGMAAEAEVKGGVPAEVILERAGTLHPDLVAISTHGRSGIARWRRGSVADKVIRGAESPLLVVGPKAVERGSWLEGEAVPTFSAIIVPLDGSPLAEQALPTALSLAAKCGSKLHLVRAVPIPITDSSDLGFDTDGQIIVQLEDAARAYMDEVAGKASAPGGIVTEVHLGPSERVLEDYVSTQGIDLIVMTSHGRSGLVRAALGSVTDRLLGNGTAPVLVVRASEAQIG